MPIVAPPENQGYVFASHVRKVQDSLLEPGFFSPETSIDKEYLNRFNWHDVIITILFDYGLNFTPESAAYYLTGDYTYLATEEALNRLPRVDGSVTDRELAQMGSALLDMTNPEELVAIEVRRL